MNESIFELNKEDHLDKYGWRPFLFRQNLSDNPLLTMDSIRKLALRLPADQVFFSSGKLDLKDDFDNAHSDKTTGLSLEETLENMEETGSYMFIRKPDTDPEYRPLLNRMIQEVEHFKGEKDPGLTDAMLYLFVASPNSVTPFHVDRYETLLTQISGSKKITIWKPEDREVVSEAELDALFARDKAGEPKYKEGLDHRGVEFEMKRGDAVHIPFTAGHCVHSGPDVSIGISIIFKTKSSERRRYAHAFNHKFNKLTGFRLRPVGQAKWMDSLKAAVIGGVMTLLGKAG